MTHIFDLPEEILLLIFEHCSGFDMLRLYRTCKYFYDLISKDIAWSKKSKKTLVTNQMSKRFSERCNPLLLSRDKWLISQAWQLRRCRQNAIPSTIFKKCTYFRPYTRLCIQMSKDHLWWCGFNEICGFKRKKHDIRTSDIIINEEIHSNQTNNFSQFVLCKDIIISGHEDGSIRKWVIGQEEEGGKKRSRLHLTMTYLDEDTPCIAAIDATSQVIISSYCTNGSRDIIKIRENINESEENRVCRKNKAVQIYDGKFAGSLAIDLTGTKLAVSLEYCHGDNNKFVRIFDINNAHSRLNEICNCGLPPPRRKRRINYTYPTGVSCTYPSEVFWEDPHTLLISEDDCLYKWDLRKSGYVCSWTTARTDYCYYDSLTCISSDYQYTMMTGGTLGIIYLWDQRRCDDHVSVYNFYDSKILSLQFDSSHLYATTNNFLHGYNFAKLVKRKVKL